MIAARQIFLGRGGAKLPYDAEVEYLESTGTQWIDTGYKHSEPCEYIIDINGIPTSSDKGILGSYITGTTGYTSVVLGFYNLFIYGFNYPGQRIDSPTYPAERDDFLISYKFGASDRTLSINGWTETKNVATYNSENVGVFATGPNGRYPSSIKCRYFKIKNANGVLVRDMIPVRFTNELGQSEGAMYDRVSGQLFRNQGTGAFLYGDDVVEVEYLESTGTQYIDTGLKGGSGYDFEYSFRPLSPLPCAIGGVYQVQSSCYIGLVRSNGMLAYNYFAPDTIVEVQAMTLGTDYDVSAHLFSGSQYFDVNGVRGGVGDRSGTFESNGTMYVFAINSPSMIYSYMRLYGLKIYYNNSLIRDFIPVRVGMEGAMMDRLTRKIYRNAGTGNFSYGADKA